MVGLLTWVKTNKVVIVLAMFLVISLASSIYGGWKLWYSRPGDVEEQVPANQADYKSDIETLECLKDLAIKYIPEEELNKCVKNSR